MKPFFDFPDQFLMITKMEIIQTYTIRYIGIPASRTRNNKWMIRIKIRQFKSPAPQFF